MESPLRAYRSQDTGGGPTTCSTGPRVLMIDDEPDILTVARIALANQGGYAVRTCTSGAEALAVAPDFSPDLVIIDVMMPDMDGPCTLQSLRKVSGLRDHKTLVEQVARVLNKAGPSGDGALEGKVAAIAARFAAKLPQRAAEIERAWANLGDDPDGGEAAEILSIVVHRLAGSALTFGHGQIGDIAQELERLLERVLDGHAPNAEENREIEARIEALRRALP